jgi:hypothetical protein
MTNDIYERMTAVMLFLTTSEILLCFRFYLIRNMFNKKILNYKSKHLSRHNSLTNCCNLIYMNNLFSLGFFLLKKKIRVFNLN